MVNWRQCTYYGEMKIKTVVGLNNPVDNTKLLAGQTRTPGHTWGGIMRLGGVSIPTSMDPWIYQ
jgi:hypothetical protein